MTPQPFVEFFAAVRTPIADRLDAEFRAAGWYVPPQHDDTAPMLESEAFRRTFPVQRQS